MQITKKYTAVSLLSTAFDFTIFFGISHCFDILGSVAVLISTSAGGVFSYFLHKNWVFSHSKQRTQSLTWRYFTGVLLGISLNAVFIGFWCDLFLLPRMWGRVVAATLTWLMLFWFNRKVVFKV